MTADDRSLERIAREALEIDDVEARSVYLDVACGGDTDARRWVEARVREMEAERAAQYFAEAPTAAPSENAETWHGFSNGDTLGKYRLIEVAGAGGFGVVWRAEQTAPVRRQVALKLIRPGMDSKAVLARFAAERQALALMDHPCVAKIFDGGVTPRGSPYFVMELVQGLPITEHCDRHRLTILERIELMIRVCEAVQHAHSKGVIHRDLKPGNILVEYEAGHSTPKVIDFGVAKALNQRLAEATLFTERGQMIGTPEYMSPEQAEMSAQDIDTRSDVYSLGVILYELLTGTRPFEGHLLRLAALAEIQRIIREVEPPRPSTRLTSMAASSADAAAAEQIAVARRTDPHALFGTLRRDLDWVVMRCLEKDRERRYETADALAAELRRFLNHEPVLAGPPSVRYKAFKFARRHRAGVLAACVSAAALLAATALSMTFALKAEAQRQHAVNAAGRADLEARTLREVHDFFNDYFLLAAAPSAEATRGPDTTLSAALASASKQVEGRFLQAPRTEAQIRHSIGGALAALDDWESAGPHLRRALDLARLHYGERSDEALTCAADLALCLWDSGSHDEAVDILRSYDSLLGDRASVSVGAVSLRYINAIYLRKVGQLDDAIRMFTDVVEDYDRLGTPNPRFALGYATHLGDALMVDGRTPDAAATLERALNTLAPRLPRHDPAVVGVQRSLAVTYRHLSRFDDALTLFKLALEGTLDVYGEAHSETVQTLNSLAVLYHELGDPEQARVMLERAIKAGEGIYPPSNETVLGMRYNLAFLTAQSGDLHEAADAYRKCLDAMAQATGELQPGVVACMNSYGQVLSELGEYDAALELLGRALRIGHELYGESGHENTVFSLATIADVHSRAGRLDEAATSSAEAVEAARKLPPPHWMLASALAQAAGVERKRRAYERACILLQEAYTVGLASLPPNHPRVRSCVAELAGTYQDWHAAESGAGHDAQAEEWNAKLVEIDGAGEKVEGAKESKERPAEGDSGE